MSAEKLRCWEGCIAVTNSPTDKINRGIIVKVLERAPTEDHEAGGIEWAGGSEPAWIVRSMSRNFDYSDIGVPSTNISSMLDTSLTPISPPEGTPMDAEDIDQPEQVAA